MAPTTTTPGILGDDVTIAIPFVNGTNTLAISNNIIHTIMAAASSTSTMSPEHEAEERQLRLLIYWINGWITLLCVTIGVFLNSFCTLIFHRMNRGKFSLAQYYLVIFLVCQTALLLNCLLIYCIPTLLYGDTQVKGIYAYVILIAHAFSGPSYIATTWIVLALTIERYFALRKPFAYRARAKASRVKRIIMILLITVFIFCIPRLFEYKIGTECKRIVTSDLLDMHSNVTTCYATVESTSLLKNKTYWNIYHIWLMLCFVTLLPSLTMLLLTLRISCFLHKEGRKRRDLSAHSEAPRRSSTLKGERESNVMLVMVVIKFAFSDPLPMAESVIADVAPEDSPAQAALLVSIADFLVILCCSINFLMFFASGQLFRRECKRILFGRDGAIESSDRFSSDDTWTARQKNDAIIMDREAPAVKQLNEAAAISNTLESSSAPN